MVGGSRQGESDHKVRAIAGLHMRTRHNQQPKASSANPGTEHLNPLAQVYKGPWQESRYVRKADDEGGGFMDSIVTEGFESMRTENQCKKGGGP
jgi:hypothetical protein